MIVIWIIALLLAIPTFGISLVGAFIINVYLNTQKEKNFNTAIAVGLTLFSLESVSKYNSFLAKNRLRTRKRDEEIAERILAIMLNIENFLTEHNRFESNKSLIQDLAVRFLAFSEVFDEYEIKEILDQELNEVSMFGIQYVVNKEFSTNFYDLLD